MFEFALAINGLLMFPVKLQTVSLLHIRSHENLETSWIFAGMHFARFNSQPSYPR